MINIGIIGCGYWGPNLIRNFHSLPGCKVKYACDVDNSRLAHMKSLYSEVDTINNYDQIVEELVGSDHPSAG